MYDSYRPHELLAQIPLTVSPFISLPTATTLPYTYKSVPSTLPPSVTDDHNNAEKPRYVVSAGGHAAHPSEIIASCEALEKHMQKIQAESQAAIKEWEESIKQRELAEKRRVAPGWLDREEKILQPTAAASSQRNSSSAQATSLLDRRSSDHEGRNTTPAIQPRSEGEELDRAFGGLHVK
ncbi:hypothetical protein AJ80_03845 [Polytolypa hystricis UAMH7299]|uniref:Uncharacterized protein n=1 Tax=Polytolypa hystricis (strain UAMH7299) TaxID=1447883 RepID=A0A2B7YER7_POLH7|nr:hypothetical protein AJ80_03845 [Polytolypa hystricis UAMH7299]